MIAMIWFSDIWKNQKGLIEGREALSQVRKEVIKMLADSHCFNPSSALRFKGNLYSSVMCHY